MRRMALAIAFRVMAASLTLASTAVAQGDPRWQGDGGWGRGGAFARLFDPSKVVTVAGKVVKIERISPSRGMSSGIHLTLATGGETLLVHLGPSWFIENQDVQIDAGDALEMTGSRVAIDGAPALLAAKVVKGEKSLTLRDAAGIPVWAGWRR